jgi:hypothetical protein
VIPPSSAGPPPAPAPFPAPGQGGPAKKKTSTLTILLAVIGGGLLLFAVVFGIVAYKIMSSPEGRSVVGMIGETVRIARKAQSAPGTKELRALGCKSAMVMDADDFSKMAEAADPGRPIKEAPFGTMVVCGGMPFGDPPGCDEVATTYVSAAGARERPFVVMVQKSGRSQPECSSLYAGDGSSLGALEAPGRVPIE